MPSRVNLYRMPGGDAGVFTTLRHMRRMALRDAPRVRSAALSIIGGAASHIDRLTAVQNFVRDAIENRSDPPGIEYVQAPTVTLFEHPAGDCDDKATLVAALLVSLGYRVRFVVIATNPAKPATFSHVYVEALAGGRWLALDAKMPAAPVGWSYPMPARIARVSV